MLDLLSKSAVRRKIIGLFAINSTQELYARQVAREVDESPHAVGLELKSLVDGGLLTRRERSGRIYYSWNSDYPYANLLLEIVQKMQVLGNREMRSLASIGRRHELQEELDKTVTRLINKYDPEKIIVFGSLASGRVHESSDVDLFVVKETRRRSFDRFKDVAPYLSRNCGMECVVWTPAEVSSAIPTHRFLREEILGKGKVVYEKAT